MMDFQMDFWGTIVVGLSAVIIAEVLIPRLVIEAVCYLSDRCYCLPFDYFNIYEIPNLDQNGSVLNAIH